MKILMVAPMPPRPQAPGAIPLVLHAQISGLVERHQVTLATVAGPEPAEWEALDRVRELGVEVQAIRRVEPSGWARWRRRWRFAGAWLGGLYPWRTIWYWEPGLQRILDRLLAERRFDLVAVEDNAMGIYRYRTTAPTIFTEYEVRRPRPVSWSGWSESGPLRWALGEADWRRWRRYQRSVWRRFDRVQVFTAGDAARATAIAPELVGKLRINPFSVDTPPMADPRRQEEGTLLFVGNFTHPPNVDAALWLGGAIMPRLRELAPGVRLTIVGPLAPESVRALACDDIQVAGQVPEIEPYMERAAVVLAPIRTGGGQRMKVLQSMALGKAVVTTPRGADGLAEAGGPPPLALAEDAEGLARAAAELLGSAAARAELGRRAHAFAAEHHSPRAYVRRLEATYAELKASECPDQPGRALAREA